MQKFISLTGHKYEITPFLMSKRTWDKLSTPTKVVREAATEATALQRKLSQESDDKLLADLKSKGVPVINGDKAAFEKATASGGRQVDCRADRPVRQEGDRCRARELKPGAHRRRGAARARRSRDRPTRRRQAMNASNPT